MVEEEQREEGCVMCMVRKARGTERVTVNDRPVSPLPRGPALRDHVPQAVSLSPSRNFPFVFMQKQGRVCVCVRALLIPVTHRFHISEFAAS